MATKPRTSSIIADGSALWLDANGNKLSRRKFTDNEVAVVIDLDKPVTLKRCRDICNKFDINHLAINDWRFYDRDTGNEIPLWDTEEIGYNTTKKDYMYRRDFNSLVIWNNGMPVYANDNGDICLDLDALADTLM